MQEYALSVTRAKLQRRWRRVLGAQERDLTYAVSAYKSFLDSDPICSLITQSLFSQSIPENEAVKNLLEQGTQIEYTNELDAAIYGFDILSRLIERNIVLNFYNHHKHYKRIDYRNLSISLFEGLFDYIDEVVDSKSEVILYMKRFQQWAHWFGHQKLDDVVKKAEATSKKQTEAEKELQSFMFERLFVDGLSLKEMRREQQLASGKPDFCFSTSGLEIVTEVKLFGSYGQKTYTTSAIKNGVKQVMQYMSEAGIYTGYLVTFNRYPEELTFKMNQHADGIPFLKLSGKIIYLFSIPTTRNLTASKSAPPRRIEEHEIIPDETD